MALVAVEAHLPLITLAQIAQALLAIPAAAPVFLCTGYCTAWFTDLHGFRRRSLTERLLWSIPLSLAVSPIASVCIGRWLSLGVFSWLTVACALFAAVLVVVDGRNFRLPLKKGTIAAMILACGWALLMVLLIVDLQCGDRLYFSAGIIDHSYRANWIEAVIHSGVPPANSLYFDQQPVAMRTFYYWYVACASVAGLTHLSARAVLIASCVWSGFGVAAIAALFLKYFLVAGERLRRQVLIVLGLFSVTGLAVLPNCYELFIQHHLKADLDSWSPDKIPSWLGSLVWAPHHTASLVCVMVALLLAWIKRERKNLIAAVLLSGAALASAFGLSIYVAFAFFLVMAAWVPWQIFVQRNARPAVLMMISGAVAALLTLPFLRELSLGLSGAYGDHLFSFHVREIFPFRFAHSGLAGLLLLVLGYAIELGFYGVVLLVYCVPKLRGVRLTPARQTLLFLSVATLVPITFLRSGVLESNDFGWRGALILQFALLLLGAELLVDWRDENTIASRFPRWLKAMTAAALLLGLLSTAAFATMLRFYHPIKGRFSARVAAKDDLYHNAWIANRGYAALDAVVPAGAVVQFNPQHPNDWWMYVDLFGVNRQIAMLSDGLMCGSLWGGDPVACPAMRAQIDALYLAGNADDAYAACRAWKIDILVARPRDPAWDEKGSWVWNLPAVVDQQEFRAVRCGERRAAFP